MVLMKFRLKKGLHVQNKDKDGKDIVNRPGDVVASEINLAKRFGKDKFERVVADEGVSEEDQQDDLASLSVRELKGLARQYGLEIAGVSKKDELIELLRNHEEGGEE